MKYLFACLILSAPLWLSAQNVKSSSTRILFENDEVKISSFRSSCVIEMEGVFNNVEYLSVFNKKSSAITISFQKEMYYNGKCFGCDGSDEQQVNLDLLANQEVKGECKLGNTPLMIFQSFQKRENKSVLTDLKVSNVKVEGSK